MNKFKPLAVALSLWFGLSPRGAHAQEWTRQSFLLPKGGFEVTGAPARPELMRIGMSRGAGFKPVEIPVNLFWGVTDDVMLGITHERGLRFNTGAPNPKLRDTYDDIGFGSVIFLANGPNYEVDLHAGVPFHQLSPDLFVGLQVGVLGRANIARNVALVYDPSLYFGVNRRAMGNGDELHLPIWFYFQATPVVVPFIGTGVHGQLNRFGDSFAVPLEGGVLFTVSRGIHIGGMLAFPNALGKNGTLDWRELGFIGQFRF